jgi:hypothetical protein
VFEDVEYSDIQIPIEVREHETVQGIVCQESELDMQDIVHNNKTFQDSQDQVFEDEEFKDEEFEEEEKAAHRDEDTWSKRKLIDGSVTSSSKRMRQIPYSNREFTSLLSVTGATAMAGSEWLPNPVYGLLSPIPMELGLFIEQQRVEDQTVIPLVLFNIADG